MVDQTAAELAATKHVTNVATPADGGGAVSDDGHSVLVDFEIKGTDIEAGTTTSSRARTRSRRCRPTTRSSTSSSSGRLRPTRSSRTVFGADLGKAGMLSLPLTLLILAIALGGLVAAGVPLLLALTGVMATMALVAIPSQFFPLDSNVGALVLLIGLAVGRRLLALLHAP